MKKFHKLSEHEIEKFALEIREFLLNNQMWQDVDIYFNGKRFGCRNPEDGHYYYNSREHLFTEEGIQPETYFEYVNPDHILSMSFEGPVCHMLSYNSYQENRKKFDELFRKRGIYYELGNHWNLTCYYEGVTN